MFLLKIDFANLCINHFTGVEQDLNQYMSSRSQDMTPCQVLSQALAKA